MGWARLWLGEGSQGLARRAGAAVERASYFLCKSLLEWKKVFVIGWRDGARLTVRVVLDFLELRRVSCWAVAPCYLAIACDFQAGTSAFTYDLQTGLSCTNTKT